MADLNDLKKFTEELLPILKELFPKASKGEDQTNRTAEKKAIRRLKKLVSEASKPTSVEHRLETIVATQTALVDVLVQASTSPVALEESTVRVIRRQINNLHRTAARVLERRVFDAIAGLLSPAKIDQISKLLTRAEEEIRTRKKAKQTLDTMIKVAIAAARIATKLA